MAKLTRQRTSKRLQARGRGGRYVKPVLDCKVCAECGHLNFPTSTEGLFPEKQYPVTCKTCEKPLREKAD